VLRGECITDRHGRVGECIAKNKAIKGTRQPGLRRTSPAVKKDCFKTTQTGNTAKGGTGDSKKKIRSGTSQPESIRAGEEIRQIKSSKLHRKGTSKKISKKKTEEIGKDKGGETGRCAATGDMYCRLLGNTWARQ